LDVVIEVVIHVYAGWIEIFWQRRNNLVKKSEMPELDYLESKGY